jgi:hypothetical protein
MPAPFDLSSRVRAALTSTREPGAPSRRTRDEDLPGEAPSAAPGTSGDTPQPADAQAAPQDTVLDAAAGAAAPADAEASDRPREDRSSALLASALGLLGVGGAASVAVSAASSDAKPPASGNEPPGPGPVKPEDKPRPPPDTSGPGPDPKPEQPGPGPDTKPDPSRSDPSKPDPAKPDDDSKPKPPEPQEPKPEEPKPEHPKPGEDPDPKPEQPVTPDPDAEPDPEVPVPLPRLLADTGVAADDRITSRADVQIDGLVANGQWRYSLDGGDTWIAGHGDRIAAPAFGPDGRKDLIVEQFDARGHRSVSSRLSFELDTLAPGAPSPSAPSNGWLGRLGEIHVGGLEGSAHWQYSLDGTNWLSGTGAGVRGLDVGKEGEQQVWLRQIDLAGNTSEVSRVTVNVDLTAPTDAAIRLHVDPAIDGPFTTQPHMTHGPITVAADAGWAYSWDGQSWRTDAEYGAVVRTQGLIDGFHTLYVRQQDQAGNVTINERSFTLDNVRPAAPTLRLVNDTGWSNVDRITSDGTLRVTNLEPNAKWWLKTVVNGKDYYQGGSGDTITTADMGLPAGEVGKVSVFLWQVDQATNQSAMTRFDFELYAQTAVI